jgi:hypothetical protein
MPRLSHGAVITPEALQRARATIAARSADVPLAFAAALPVDVQDFDFLFPDLQNDPANLLPESRQTRDSLVALGTAMDEPGRDPAGNSTIPAAYTYFGQFVDHDVTLEVTSATGTQLVDPNLTPLPLDQVRDAILNARTATLDLDSIYGIPAPRVGDRMQLGTVTALGGTGKPQLRPPGKDDANDLPREEPSTSVETDRAAKIGDPRNDENTIIAQMHVAFLRAHNVLVDQGKTFDDARRILRQHYQHIVVHDFLKKRIADRTIVENILQNGNRFYRAMAEPFFLPLEFSVAAYRFGHSMVRAAYDFNLNFNFSGEPGTLPATLGLLFTFTAFAGQLGSGQGNPTLPENWIIEWPNIIDAGGRFNTARRIDTQLVEPLFHLTDIVGAPLPGDEARLAVRNLLRGYLLRMPTGQAVARAMGETPLTPAEIEAAAAKPAQVQALRDGGFLDRTPLWYYLLAEAKTHADGQHLGRVGSTLVAEVLIGLVGRSEDSILRYRGWTPSLPSQTQGDFELVDLLRFAGVLA